MYLHPRSFEATKPSRTKKTILIDRWLNRWELLKHQQHMVQGNKCDDLAANDGQRGFFLITGHTTLIMWVAQKPNALHLGAMHRLRGLAIDTMNELRSKMATKLMWNDWTTITLCSAVAAAVAAVAAVAAATAATAV